MPVLKSAKTSFEIGKTRFGVGRKQFWGCQKPVLESRKTGFEIGKKQFWSRQKPVLNREKLFMKSEKTGLQIGKNRFWNRQKPVLKTARTGFGVGRNHFFCALYIKRGVADGGYSASSFKILIFLTKIAHGNRPTNFISHQFFRTFKKEKGSVIIHDVVALNR